MSATSKPVGSSGSGVKFNAKLPPAKKSTFEISQKSGSDEIEVVWGSKTYKVVFYRLSNTGKEKLHIDLTKNVEEINKAVRKLFDAVGAHGNLQQLDKKFKGEVTKFEIYFTRPPGSDDSVAYTPELDKFKITDSTQSHAIQVDLSWWRRKVTGSNEEVDLAGKIKSALTELGTLLAQELPKVKAVPGSKLPANPLPPPVPGSSAPKKAAAAAAAAASTGSGGGGSGIGGGTAAAGGRSSTAAGSTGSAASARGRKAAPKRSSSIGAAPRGRAASPSSSPSPARGARPLSTLNPGIEAQFAQYMQALKGLTKAELATKGREVQRHIATLTQAQARFTSESKPKAAACAAEKLLYARQGFAEITRLLRAAPSLSPGSPYHVMLGSDRAGIITSTDKAALIALKDACTRRRDELITELRSNNTDQKRYELEYKNLLIHIYETRIAELT